MKNLNKIDLHGIKHEDVRSEVIHFIEANWNSNKAVEIITGRSKDMIAIVEEVLNEYKLDYKIGDFFEFNKSYIKVEL